MRPLILVSNDDGYSAAGLIALREALRAVGEVVTCAPASEQSSMSHALSLHKPLRLVQRETNVFSVDGTPADCVYVALHAGSRILPRRPDLVVAGINHGLNLGNDVNYSGTVAAAREGALRGIPAIAASGSTETDLAAAAAVVARLANRLVSTAQSGPLLLNVNFPAGSAWPTCATTLGTRSYEDDVKFRRDPRGNEYLWLGGPGVENCRTAGTDTKAYQSGSVGITPLSIRPWNSEQQPFVEQLSVELSADSGQNLKHET